MPLESGKINSSRAAFMTACTPQRGWILIYVTSVFLTLPLCAEVPEEQGNGTDLAQGCSHHTVMTGC